jgi:hypothetical protein
MMKAPLKGWSAALCLTIGKAFVSSCSSSEPPKPIEDLAGNLPIDKALDYAAPASIRQGMTLSSASSGTSVEDGRAIRHDEYLVQIGLIPEAVPGFEERFCGELRRQLASRTGLQGGGSGAAGCSFNLSHEGRHAWITVSPLGLKEEQYHLLVVVDEW